MWLLSRSKTSVNSPEDELWKTPASSWVNRILFGIDIPSHFRAKCCRDIAVLSSADDTSTSTLPFRNQKVILAFFRRTEFDSYATNFTHVEYFESLNIRLECHLWNGLDLLFETFFQLAAFNINEWPFYLSNKKSLFERINDERLSLFIISHYFVGIVVQQ